VQFFGTIMSKETIQFLRQKDFRYIKDIGQGGTGKTILLKDEIINEVFVCKKYSPYFKEDSEKYYINFLTEIKILHTLFHNNIVRVFNYYLYPDKKTGYILMDYIKGHTISNYVAANPDRINDIFTQIISGFKYLEENEILHRDIRPENILVTETGIVKIIDFGFGKQIVFNEDYDKSVSLNWRYPVPDEFSNEIYSQATEVYFVGKLIEEIIDDNKIENFGYPRLLKSMVLKKPEKRIPTFLSAQREMFSQESNLLEFNDYDKLQYKNFASSIDTVISKIRDDANYISDIDKVIKSLEDILQVSSLEDHIQNPSLVIQAFIKGDYYYKRNSEFLVLHLKHFIELLRQNSIERRKVIVNNLWQRFDKKPRYGYNPVDDDLPF
jgi:eukaryotic-like serine/threonine-protein kinase